MAVSLVAPACNRRLAFCTASAGSLSGPLTSAGFFVAGMATTGPSSVFGVRMAAALEKLPGAATRGGITMTLAGWGG
jgi:hypothetical protein